MSFRLVLALLCMTSAGGLGFLWGQRLLKRIRMLEHILRFLDRLGRELEFGREPLPQIFEKLSGKSREPLKSFLRQTANDITEKKGNMYEIFSQNIQTYLNAGELSGTDIQELREFGRELGYPDRQLQMHTVEVLRQEIQRRVLHLKEQYPKSCRLCRTLGVAGGILLAVLLW